MRKLDAIAQTKKRYLQGAQAVEILRWGESGIYFDGRRSVTIVATSVNSVPPGWLTSPMLLALL